MRVSEVFATGCACNGYRSDNGYVGYGCHGFNGRNYDPSYDTDNYQYGGYYEGAGCGTPNYYSGSSFRPSGSGGYYT